MKKIEDIKSAFFEINEILKNMPLSYTEKIPNKLKILINENKVNNGFVYNNEITLDKQDTLKDTKIFLSILYRLYWCSDVNKKGKF